MKPSSVCKSYFEVEVEEEEEEGLVVEAGSEGWHTEDTGSGGGEIRGVLPGGATL